METLSGGVCWVTWGSGLRLILFSHRMNPEQNFMLLSVFPPPVRQSQRAGKELLACLHFPGSNFPYVLLKVINETRHWISTSEPMFYFLSRACLKLKRKRKKIPRVKLKAHYLKKKCLWEVFCKLWSTKYTSTVVLSSTARTECVEDRISEAFAWLGRG